MGSGQRAVDGWLIEWVKVSSCQWKLEPTTWPQILQSPGVTESNLRFNITLLSRYVSASSFILHPSSCITSTLHTDSPSPSALEVSIYPCILNMPSNHPTPHVAICHLFSVCSFGLCRPIDKHIILYIKWILLFINSMV